MWPYVQINNKNQMQGPVTEVERHLLFIGAANFANHHNLINFGIVIE